MSLQCALGRIERDLWTKGTQMAGYSQNAQGLDRACLWTPTGAATGASRAVVVHAVGRAATLMASPFDTPGQTGYDLFGAIGFATTQKRS